jgi:Protein of unknown function (DUF998)
MAESVSKALRRPSVERSTSVLLVCGLLAGPLFVSVAVGQALLRDGFDLRRHPLSLLSLGELGWVQVTNFVVTGLLSIAFAAGMWRVLHPGRGGTWGPLLVGAFGAGLVLGGVFITDPSLGFPPGAPEAMPDHYSWHATVHNIAPGISLDALILACVVFVRRFAGLHNWRWVTFSAATAVAVLVLSWWPGLDGISIRLATAVTVALGWTTALAARLLTETAQSIDPAAEPTLAT